ncbi:MAG: hypothetical protein GY800_13775 [Planctomycetes bacterium]|nr:hypothetical protein [Planctomycetota bacterium]
MPDLTDKEKNAEKQRRFRLRQSEAGRHEVRGIYATPEQEEKIKAFARSIKQPSG